jgi:hypothetical protein
MSAHIQRFIDRVQGLESRGGAQFTMPMSDAKGVVADLTRLLLELNDLKQRPVAQEEVIQIKMDGGSF